MNAEIDRADVAVIGAGVSGACIARTLARYHLDVVLLEAKTDVGFGVSKANSGIVHGGFHHDKRFLKSRLELAGNPQFDALKSELDIPFERNGILVVAMRVEEMKYLEALYRRGVANAVPGISMLSADRLRRMEPTVHPDAVGALHAPNGGIVEPYRLVFALVENAVANGVQLRTEFAVSASAPGRGERTVLHAADGRRVAARWVVNAAGLHADEVSTVLGAESFSISARKGQYYILDKNCAPKPTHVLFPVPTPISKGMLVTPTVEGTVLLGPSAEDVGDKTDVATTSRGLEHVLESSRTLVPGIREPDVISAYAGLRPALPSDDFLIEQSERNPAVIHVAGIQSPGLTAAPAIGGYVAEILEQAGCELVPRTDFEPTQRRAPELRNVPEQELDALLRRDPRYGEVVCRCEEVSEAEISDAIDRGHTTLDGIKFYSRAGMGRCQGGFCTYRILKLLSARTGKTIHELTKRGTESYVCTDTMHGVHAVRVQEADSPSAGDHPHTSAEGGPDDRA